MNKHVRLLAVLTVCWTTSAGTASEAKTKPAPAGKGLEGVWQGTLQVEKIELRLVIHIHKKEDGTRAGTLDSPDQGAEGLACDDIRFQDGTVRLEWKLFKAVFEGKLIEDGSSLAGHWKQSSLSLPLTFHRLAKAPKVVRPQVPVKPYPYEAEEVAFENKKAGVKFAGTLTRPRSGGPFPAVVLISGSGPQDRDETIAGHKPFLVLADHLTRKGIAVLRVDDRGVGGSTGKAFEASAADEAEDALAAVAYLKGRPEINPKKIGLVGHSEGGIIAPLAAVQCRDVAFLVLLAAPGLPGEEILYLQSEAILKALGVTEEHLKLQRALQEMIFTTLRQEKDNDKAKQLILERLGEKLAKLPDDEQKKLESVRELIEAQLEIVLTPWFRFFLDHDPQPTLQKVQVPVLALIGEKDLQVPVKANVEALSRSLQDGGNKDYTVKEMPGLNHLFQTTNTGSILEYARIEETFAPAALNVISDWIVQHTSGKQGQIAK